MLFFSCKEKNNYTPVVVATHSSGKQFIEEKSCMECHATIFKSHIETSHFKSSAIATENTIGQFSDAEKTLEINDDLIIKLEEIDSSFYQNTYQKNTNKIIDSKQIDIVIGSGTKGKTYLSWAKDSLHQLHASYFSGTKSLLKSPGYFDNRKSQNKRPITERCLECHTTFAKVKSVKNTFKKSKIILGIQCQRCHGPAEKHVSFHKNNPDENIGQFITSISKLNRKLQLDGCALCHSGNRKRAKKPRFSYLIGDNLDDFSTQDYFSPVQQLDVHGNQVGMLKASTCFQKSKNMICVTCHNPHKNQRNKTNYFINKCLSCHSDSHQKKCSVALSKKKNNNCISCHMPSTVSKTMFAKNTLSKDTTSVNIISHLIKIYEN